MPLTTIQVRKTYSQAEEISLIEAVQDALLTSLKLPADDRNVLLQVNEEHRMIVSSALSDPLKLTVIQIALFAGRSKETKRRFYQTLVENLEGCAAKIPRDHVLICLQDIPLENWGIRGGQSACDVDLGFEVKL